MKKVWERRSYAFPPHYITGVTHVNNSREPIGIPSEKSGGAKVFSCTPRVTRETVLCKLIN